MKGQRPPGPLETPLALQCRDCRRFRRRVMRRRRASDVHGLRVALRRLALVAWLDAATSSGPATLDQVLGQQVVPEAMRVLGKVRDCDVLIQCLTELALTAKGPDRPVAERSLRRLRRRRRRWHQRAREVLSSRPFRLALFALRRAGRRHTDYGGAAQRRFESLLAEVGGHPGWTLPAFEARGRDREREGVRHALRARLRELRDLAALFGDDDRLPRDTGAMAGAASQLLGELRDWNRLRRLLEAESPRLAVGALARLRVLAAEWAGNKGQGNMGELTIDRRSLLA